MKALIVRPIFVEETEVAVEDIPKLVGERYASIPISDGVVGIVNADAFLYEGVLRNLIVYDVFGRCVLGTCILCGDGMTDLPDLGNWRAKMRKVEEHYAEIRRRFGE